MKGKNANNEENPLFTHHASWAIIDAWLAIPPCNYSENPYCHVDCPYFYECYPPDDEDEL